MEDLTGVLYALVGTQIALIVVGLWCRSALAQIVNEIKSHHRTQVDVWDTLRDQTRILEKELRGNAGRAQSSQAHYSVLLDQASELQGIRRLLEDQARYKGQPVIED